MHPEGLSSEIVEGIRRALDEDIGSGDITSQICVPATARARGSFISREDLVVAGVELLPKIYELRDCGALELAVLKQNGDETAAGQEIARVRGNARTLLECERTALNYLQHLSGIATVARSFAHQVEGTRCRVLDTRKTTPGLRHLEKQAAAAGGVVNHRMGLFDAVLIKNNHIAAAGGVANALEGALEAQRQSGGKLPVEIEVRSHEELEEALRGGAKHLLLDNLSPADARAWVAEIAGRAVVELSGGINLENVRAYAETGADFVSAGAITHSARAVDISFRLQLL